MGIMAPMGKAKLVTIRDNVSRRERKHPPKKRQTR